MQLFTRAMVLQNNYQTKGTVKKSMCVHMWKELCEQSVCVFVCV